MMIINPINAFHLITLILIYYVIYASFYECHKLDSNEHNIIFIVTVGC